MDKMVIVGGERLLGETHVSGSKNAALPLIYATILADGPCTIRGVPGLRTGAAVQRLLYGPGRRLRSGKYNALVPAQRRRLDEFRTCQVRNGRSVRVQRPCWEGDLRVLYNLHRHRGQRGGRAVRPGCDDGL